MYRQCGLICSWYNLSSLSSEIYQLSSSLRWVGPKEQICPCIKEVHGFRPSTHFNWNWSGHIPHLFPWQNQTPCIRIQCLGNARYSCNNITTTLSFYNNEPSKNKHFLILLSSLARNSQEPELKRIFEIPWVLFEKSLSLYFDWPKS